MLEYISVCLGVSISVSGALLCPRICPLVLRISKHVRVAPCVLGDVCISALVKARDLRPALEWIFQSEDQVLVVPGKGEK